MNIDQRTGLAASLGLTAAQIKAWFKYRRTRHKKATAASSAVKKESSAAVNIEATLSSNSESFIQHDVVYSQQQTTDTSKLKPEPHCINMSVYDEFMPQYVWYT